MIEKLTKSELAAALGDDDKIAVYLAAAFKTGNPDAVAHALGVVARAKGVAEIARKAGLSRELLYRSFSKGGNPTLKSTFALMRALGMEITTKPHAEQPQAKEETKAVQKRAPRSKVARAQAARRTSPRILKRQKSSGI